MSSTIIYHQLGLLFPKESTGRREDLFAIVAQAGASNCYEIRRDTGGNGRRSREWTVLALGSELQVMQQSIRIAGGFEGGGLKMRHMGGDIRPEQYIRTARGLLQRATNIMRGALPYKDGFIMCHFTIPPRPDAGSNGARGQDVPLHEQAPLKAWLGSADFEQMLTAMRPSALLAVSGPSIRG